MYEVRAGRKRVKVLSWFHFMTFSLNRAWSLKNSHINGLNSGEAKILRINNNIVDHAAVLPFYAGN